MAKFDGFGVVCGNFPSKDVGKDVFGGFNSIQQQMNVEAALARAQAALGIIPQEAADEITRKCDANLIDEAEYIKQQKITNHPLVCLVRTYNDICENGWGKFVHFGTTSQDISDTAMMLQLKQAYEVIYEKTVKMRDVVAEKARKYRSLVVMGRSNDQQALPITLGFRMASWADEINRSIERLEQSKDRIFVGQFAGAVGTMASLEEHGPAVQEMLLKELNLGVPQIAWYSSRDRIAEIISIFSILTCTLGRIGNEVYNNSRNEVDELAEGFKPGKVGSSTMPHKRNPFVSATLVAYARMSRTMMVDILTCMEATNERDARTLFMENEVIAKSCCLADCALDTAIDLISDLEVHENGIKRNLYILNGLVFSEALMMLLSGEFGRLEAHEMVYELAQKAISENLNFRDLVVADPVIGKKFSAEEIDKIMDPVKYIGLSEYFVDKVVGE